MTIPRNKPQSKPQSKPQYKLPAKPQKKLQGGPQPKLQLALTSKPQIVAPKNKPQLAPPIKPQGKPLAGLDNKSQNKPDKPTLLSSTPHAVRASIKERFQMATSPKIPTLDPQAISAAQAALASAPSADAPGVDKIRELLFGNQMQDYDKRFSVLEDRFQQKMRDLEGESSRSLGSLESSIKKQLESIAGQVRQEQELRAEGDKELGRGLREVIQGLEKRLGQVSDRLASLEREFTERLGHESQTLRDEIRRRNEDARATIERMFSELSNVKTDRNLLAGLFVEIARCLNQDMTQKGAKVVGGERS